MIVYDLEVLDGIADKIKATSTISYASVICPTPLENINSSKYKLNKSIANLEDSDLYYVQSILVTSSWNKNDDIFDKSEVWLSRNTPEDKPTNLEHDEGVIIGHIVSNLPINENGEPIDENTDISDLPNKFHILTGSVIYKGFSNPDLKARSEKLIEEIENATKYVSMECYFKNFDYGLINKENNEYKILSRNAETSFLTKYLRAYGGLGEHEGYKIGRVLRGITFSGKGYVDKPANPDSIIFNGEKMFKKKKHDLVKAGVSIESPNNMENNKMNIETELEDLKAKVEAASNCTEATKEAFTLAMELKEKVSSLETALANKEQEIEVLKNQNSEVVAAAEKTKAEADLNLQKLQSDLEAALETVGAYKKKEAEMMKHEKKMKRMAHLMELGLDNETAASTTEKLESLEDEAFESFSQILKSTLTNKVEVSSKETEVVSSEKTVVTAEVLETAEVTPEADLSVGGEDDGPQNTTRAALIDFMYSRLQKKNLNKGE